MPPEAPRDAQKRQFERAVKSLRDLGPTIIDAASYAEEAYLASDRPDVELANAREYIVSTLASVADGLALAAGRLSDNVQREGEEAIAETELLVAAYSQRVNALSISGILEDVKSESPNAVPGATHASGLQSDGPKQQEDGMEGVNESQEADDGPGDDPAGSGEVMQTGNPASKSAKRRNKGKSSTGASSGRTVQDCLDRMAGLALKKPEVIKETGTSYKGTPSAKEQTPTPSSAKRSDSMFESPPWDWKPIEKVYTADSGLDGDGLTAFDTPGKELRGRQEVPRSAGTKGLTLNASALRGGTGSSEDSLRLFRPPAGPASVPRADTGDTSQADWEELEVGSQHTEEYYRGVYDDEELMMLGGTKTPEAGQMVYDRRIGNSGTVLPNGSAVPGSLTTPHRTRKRDIIKRAISKFKLNGHEHGGVSAEASLDQPRLEQH